MSFRQEWPVVVSDGMYRPLVGAGAYDSVSEMIEYLKGYDRIYLLDIDAIESYRLQTDVIHRLSIWKEVWVDTAPRDIATITDAYIAGADRVVVSTKRMPSLELLKASISLSDRIIFTVDHKDGVISPSKHIASLGIDGLIDRALELGVETVVILDLSDDEFNYDILTGLPEADYSLYIGGNIVEGREIPGDVDGLILGFQEVVTRQSRD